MLSLSPTLGAFTRSLSHIGLHSHRCAEPLLHMMLSNSRCDASERLRRTRSASSVSRKPVLRVPMSDHSSSVHQDAVTAANLAFKRGTSLHATELRPLRLARTSSTRLMAQARTSGEGSHLSRRNSRIGRSSIDQMSDATTIQNRAKGPEPDYAPAASSQAPSTNDDVFSMTSPEQRFAERYDGYGLPFTSRLRRAKSGQGYPSTQPKTSTSPNVLARRLTVAAPATRENQSDDAIIAMARDKYLSDHQMRPLRKRSSFFAPLLSKTRKTKRDSMNTDDTLSQGRPSTDAHASLLTTLEHHSVQAPPQQMTISKQALVGPEKTRKTSSSLSSLKNGFRRTFGQSGGSSGQQELPPQHVVSTRQHYISMSPSATFDTRTSITVTAPSQHPPQPSSSPPTPPIHRFGVARPPSQHMPDPALEQELEEYRMRSRVTSWNDSTRRNTLMTLDAPQLPSIQESPESRKVSVPTTDLLRETRMSGPVVPIRRSSSRFTLRGAVDGARLISALMKHKRSLSGEKLPARQPSLTNVSRNSTGPSGPLPMEELRAEEAAYGTRSSSVRHAATDCFYTQHDKQPPPFYGHCDSLYQYIKLTSPSVYSEHPDIQQPAERVTRSSEIRHDPGMATVLDQEAVASFSLEAAVPKGHKHTTSNEWRMWVTDETSGLGGRSSFSLPALTAPGSLGSVVTVSQMQRKVPYPQKASPSGDGDSSSAPDTPDWIDASPTRPSKEQRTVSYMPSRQASGRTTNRRSSNTEPFPSFSVSSNEESHDDDDGNAYPASRNVSGEEPSNIDLLAPPKRKSSSTRLSLFNKHKDKQSRLPRLSKLSTEGSGIVAGDWSESKRQSPTLDENFLLRIRNGPYNASGSTLARLPMSSNSINLPKRSSPAVGNENTPPSRGQRMMEDFLSKRSNGGDSSPAFV